MARVAVLDPSALFRAALVSLLRQLGFTDLIEAGDFNELARLIEPGAGPDVVLISLSRASEPVDQTVHKVGAMLPQAKTVFLAPALDLSVLAKCFAAGASGYLLENISSDALGKSLTLVSAGGKVFPPELAPLIPTLAARPAETQAAGPVMPNNSHLSGREIEILRCLTRGQSNKAIAHTLDIAEATVKVHVKRILRKIAATNRTQAALWAASRGLTATANANTRTVPEIDLMPIVSPTRHVALRQTLAIRTSSGTAAD